jgi:hypothetical protein
LFGSLAEASLYGTPFLFLGFVVRKGFAPQRVAQLGCGGFLMLEYQKSSAAAPKLRNWFGVGIFLAGVFALAGVICRRTMFSSVVAMLVHHQL